jgi:signal transduction histidine kinase
VVLEATRRRLLAGLPIRARIALFGAAVVLLTVVIFGALVDVLFEHSVYAQQDQSLERRTLSMVSDSGRPRGAQGVGPVRGIDPGRPQVSVDLRNSNDTFLEFIDRDGAPILTTGEVDGRAPRVDRSLLQQATTSGNVLTTIEDAGLVFRVSVRPLPSGRIEIPSTSAQPAFVAVGQSATSIVGEVNQLRLYLLLAALLSLVAALAASWVVAGRALRPLDNMTETVEAIGSASDLGRRLPAVLAGDEVGRLTGAFNAMMGRLDETYGRLEGALASQRRFVADASHELRTPLTSIRSNLGLLMGRADISAVDRREALQDMDAEAQRMSRLVADLLTLARADAGQQLEMATVDLPALCEEVRRQARRTYPDRTVELARRPVPPLKGNGDSLRQLLWILVDNAARHTRAGGRIAVSLVAAAGEVRLVVADDGDGIAASDRERIFERFYRADRARGVGGAGLGLSIARWIVLQHGGRIVAGPNPEGAGAAFTVELPLSPDEIRAVA